MEIVLWAVIASSWVPMSTPQRWTVMQAVLEQMIALPPGVRVWLAGGTTDMRRGMNGLALQVQQGLGRDPRLPLQGATTAPVTAERCPPG